MKKAILTKILQEFTAVKATLKQLFKALRELPVKEIIDMIVTAINKLRVLAQQWIASAMEFAVSKAGKLPILN